MTDRALDIETEYTRRLVERQRVLAAAERRHARFGSVRLLIAAAAVAIFWIGGLDLLAWLLVPLGAFVVVAFAHANLLNRSERIRSAIHFYERGLARIRHEWIGHGRTGDAYRPPDHLYADDLDLFGRGSLFELLATTRTQAGEATVAAWLLAPAPHEVARKRQGAVAELARRLDLRERVAVIGDHVKVAVDAPLLRRWAATAPAIGGGAIRAGVALLVAITLTTLTWWLQTGALSTMAAVLLLVQVAVGAWLRPRVVAVIEAVDEPAHDLDVLAQPAARHRTRAVRERAPAAPAAGVVGGGHRIGRNRAAVASGGAAGIPAQRLVRGSGRTADVGHPVGLCDRYVEAPRRRADSALARRRR